MQAQFAAGNLGQVAALLRIRAVAQQRAHVVHLAVAGPGIAAATVDFFHHHRGFGQPQARATVFLRDHHPQPARAGQRVHKFLRVGTRFVDLAKVRVRKAFEKIAQCSAQLRVTFLIHHAWFLKIRTETLSGTG